MTDAGTDGGEGGRTGGGAGVPEGMMTMMDRVRDLLTVERVVGAPIERDGVTLIPVVALRGGGGGGGGEGVSDVPQNDLAHDDLHRGGPGRGSGAGMGFGVSAHPGGAYVIKDGSVSWQPSVDPARMGLVAVAMAFLMFRWLTVRSKRRS